MIQDFIAAAVLQDDDVPYRLREVREQSRIANIEFGPRGPRDIAALAYNLPERVLRRLETELDIAAPLALATNGYY